MEGQQPDIFTYNPTTNDYYSWLSYFYKSCRIGDAKNAVIAGEILRKMKGEAKVIDTLIQLVGEDLHPVYYQKLLPVINSYREVKKDKIDKAHNFWLNIYLLAKSPKWYMDNVFPLDDSDVWLGTELEEIRQLTNTELLLHEKQKAFEIVETTDLPKWVFDRHTHSGKIEYARTRKPTPLDGNWDNRFNVKERWDKVFNENKGDSYDSILKKYISLFYEKDNDNL